MREGPSCPTKPLTAEERKELQDEIKQAVLQAAQSAGNDVPADIKRMIKELTEPKLSWKDVLRVQMESSLVDFTFMRRPKVREVIFPGMNKDEELHAYLHWTCLVVLMMKLLRRCLVKHMVLCNNMIATRLLYYVLTQVIYNVETSQ